MEKDLPADRQTRTLKRLFSRQWGRTVLISLLVLAILPATVIGLIAYRMAEGHLRQEIPNTVRAMAELKQREVQAFFDDRRTDTAMLGREPSTIGFYGALCRRLAGTDGPITDFVHSMPWNMAVAAYGAPVSLHADLHDYGDILLVDPRGNVIFSTAQESKLGANLLSAELTETPFAAAFRETLASGHTIISGFTPDSADRRTETAFVTAPIGVDAASPSGVIACKISIAAVANRLQWNSEPTKGLRLLLVDNDRRLLVDSTAEHPLWNHPRIETAIIRAWQEMDPVRSARLPISIPMTYTDSRGREVTGVYAGIRLSEHPLALIVEIDHATALICIHRLRIVIWGVMIFASLAVLLAAVIVEEEFSGPLRDLSQQTFRLTQSASRLPTLPGNGNVISRLAATFAEVLDHLERLQRENALQLRRMADQASLHRLLDGEYDLDMLYNRALDHLAAVLALHRALIYVNEKNGSLTCACRFPKGVEIESEERIYPGEGRAGQTALERNIHTFRTNAPHQPAIPVAATGQANLITVPILLRESLIGVLELEKHTVFTPADLQFVRGAAEMIAVALHAASIRAQEERLLKDNRQQAKALKIREAALEASRRELMAQNQALQASEHKLHLKQLELEAANAQMLKNTTALEAHMAVLEQQKQEMQRQNAALEHAHTELAKKARQLERSSRYKTEFMANMSHELRTPLNSILLLSRLLVEDKDDTLTDRQVAFARTIHSAGGDLINLINEILDLAAVESGKVKIDIQSVALRAIADAMQASFAPLAEQNGIAFSIHLEPDLPEYVTTDGKRLKQIVKNFLSNAFKFTTKGSIDLKFALGQPPAEISAPDGSDSPCLTITVADTGIGIPADKQELIFEAFQQVDGSIRRTYGGTGLGLSISRLLTQLIGGTITLESREGEGSRFTLHLPFEPSATSDHASAKTQTIVTHISPPDRPPAAKAGAQAAGTTSPSDVDPATVETPHILIIANKAETITVLQTHARRKGFAPLLADRFATGLHLADHYLPKAIFIDPALPGGYGEAMIQGIKDFPGIRHIPVFALMPEESDPASVLHGAAGRIAMPIADDAIAAALAKSAQWANDPTRTVLVLDPRNRVGPRIIDTAGISTIRFVSATSVAEAVATLDRDPVNLLILDPEIDEGERRSLFEILRRHPPLPIFFYFGRPAEKRPKETVASDARSFDTAWIDGDDALLPALMAYLHLPLEALDESQRARLTALDNDRFQLRGHRILLADDDMRTVFAVSSILEDKGMTVLTGKNGKESLDKLDHSPEIDLIIMDVMMADGYQAIRRIRGQARYQNVPIIALTAKAMPGDRARCIEAGADDYLAKPVNLDILTSMLKVWLNPQRVGPKANNTAHG